MGAAPAVVCAQIVGSDDGPGILRYKHGVARRMPVGYGVLARDVARDGICLPGAQGRLEDAPDSVVVSMFRLPDQHGWRSAGSARLGGMVRGGNPQPELPCYEGA